MIVLNDLEQWRSIPKMREFYQETYKYIDNNIELKRNARLKTKGYVFKELLEEFKPLLDYVELSYSDESLKCRYVGLKTLEENIKYDGEILFQDGSLEKVEIAAPRDGAKEKIHAIQLNDRGFSYVEFYSLEEIWLEIKNQIITTAKKKAVKNYIGVTLVIVFEYLLYVDPIEPEGTLLIKDLIEELKQIKYSSEKVFLLIPPFNASNGNYTGVLYKIN